MIILRFTSEELHDLIVLMMALGNLTKEELDNLIDLNLNDAIETFDRQALLDRFAAMRDSLDPKMIF